MDHQQKLEAIRIACIAVNPSIKDFPRFPQDSETLEAIRTLSRIVAFNPEQINKDFTATASMYLENYEKEKRAAYVRYLEGKYIGRDIQLADVLLVIIQRQKEPTQEGYIWNVNKKTLKLLEMWNMLKPCHLQEESTISFIYELIN